MCDACPTPTTGPLARLTRRRFLQAGAAAATAALLPGAVGAAPGGKPTGLVNPYTGAIPLVFPLPAGTYRSPVRDNWHDNREGAAYAWSHVNSATQRAHDGVDIFPRVGQPLPPVYAPFVGKVAAVCWRTDNSADAQMTYAWDSATPPPHDYHLAIDTVSGSPLYGNFIWLVDGAGYFAFYCHLQNDTTLHALADRLALGENVPVDATTAVGVMGDTGNAVGDPQLHVEIHYPQGSDFACRHCPAGHARMTAIDPYRSLANATPR